MSNVTGIVFDLDGTLIDSAPDIAAAVNRYLVDNGWPEQDTAFVEKFIGFGSRKLLVDLFIAVGHPVDQASVDRALLAYLDNYRAKPADRTRVFPQVREDIAMLRGVGFRLGICTNKPHEMTGRVLEALGLAEFFEVVLGADAVPASKPDPEHLLEVGRRMGLSVDEYVYVGDTAVDQRTAAGAGVTFLAVPWGGGETLELPPSHRLSRLADIQRFVSVTEKIG